MHPSFDPFPFCPCSPMLRYVPLIEVMTPLYTVEALLLVYSHLFRHGEGATQDLGLDEVWCAWLGSKLYGGDGPASRHHGEQPAAVAAAPAAAGAGGGAGRAGGAGSGSGGAEGPDGRAACVVVDAAVAVKLPHGGHAYGVKAALADRRRVHAMFAPFVFAAKDRELTRGVCVRRCGTSIGTGGARDNGAQKHGGKAGPPPPPSKKKGAFEAKTFFKPKAANASLPAPQLRRRRRLKNCKWCVQLATNYIAFACQQGRSTVQHASPPRAEQVI